MVESNSDPFICARRQKECKKRRTYIPEDKGELRKKCKKGSLIKQGERRASRSQA